MGISVNMVDLKMMVKDTVNNAMLMHAVTTIKGQFLGRVNIPNLKKRINILIRYTCVKKFLVLD